MKNQKEANDVRAKFAQIVRDSVEAAVAGDEDVQVTEVGGKLFLFDVAKSYHAEVSVVVKDPEKFDLDDLKEEVEAKATEKARKAQEAADKKAKREAEKAKKLAEKAGITE